MKSWVRKKGWEVWGFLCEIFCFVFLCKREMWETKENSFANKLLQTVIWLFIKQSKTTTTKKKEYEEILKRQRATAVFQNNFAALHS